MNKRLSIVCLSTLFAILPASLVGRVATRLLRRRQAPMPKVVVVGRAQVHLQRSLRAAVVAQSQALPLRSLRAAVEAQSQALPLHLHQAVVALPPRVVRSPNW